MKPAKVLDALEGFLKSHCPAGLKFEFLRFHGCEAFVFDPTSEWIGACRRGDSGSLRQTSGFHS